MNWQGSDLKRLRKPLITAGVASLLLAGVIYFGQQILENAQAGHINSQNDTLALEQKAQAAVSDKANLATYRADFDELRQRRVLGGEDRLSWVEYFSRLRVQGRPSELVVNIEPRRVMEDPPVTSEPLENLQYYASRLSWEAKLLHEGDALAMLAGLKQLPGASMPRQCLIQRADGAGQARPYLLSMKCISDVITLDLPLAITPEQVQ